MSDNSNPEAAKATTAQLEKAVRLILDCCPHDGPRDEIMRERLLDLRERLYAMQNETKYSDGREVVLRDIARLIEWSLF